MQRFPRYVATAVVAAAVGLAAVGAAGATGSYPDTAGDGNGAPDIAKVTVSSDAAGQILFTIAVDNLPKPADIQTLLLLNTDMSEDTGGPDTYGADYAFLVDESDHSYGFFRWSGSDWVETPYTTVRVFSRQTGVTISVNRSELGNTGEFNFWTRTITGDVSAETLDDAPDIGVWNYSLEAAGPNILGVLVQATPQFGPQAGKPFSINPISLKLPPSGEPVSILPSPDTYSCAAKLKGTRLSGSGKGGCTWNLPRNARGKLLVVVVTVTYQGASKSVPFTYRVG